MTERQSMFDARRLALLVLIALATLIWLPAPAGTAHAASIQDRIDDLQQEVDSLREGVVDLGEPVEEFDIFDQCMYLIGVTEHGSRSGKFGYLYGGGRRLRPAFAMDIGGFAAPEFRFLAFPGEEPPSIECNEDAGGLFTN